MRHLKKMNYSYQQKEDFFASYPMHLDDVKKFNDSEEIFKEWSIRDSEAQEFKEGIPVEFKTLNLVKIIKILNSVANDEFQPTLIASLALDFNLTK